MVTENKQPCDPDDVVCQMEVLRHLQGLEQQLGSEKFLEKYPELGPLKERLPAEIAQQQQLVDSGLAECAGEEKEPPVETVAEEEPVETVVSEEPRPDQEPIEERPE